MCGPVQISSEGDISSLPETVGHDGFRCSRPATRSIAHAVFSNVVFALQGQTPQRKIRKIEILGNLEDPAVPLVQGSLWA